MDRIEEVGLAVFDDDYDDEERLRVLGLNGILHIA